jgi:hypothetical protein
MPRIASVWGGLALAAAFLPAQAADTAMPNFSITSGWLLAGVADWRNPPHVGKRWPMPEANQADF